MDELRKLIEEKKQLEKRIKELQSQYWSNGRVEVKFEEHRYIDDSYYTIRIKFSSPRAHKPRNLTISECKGVSHTIVNLQQLQEDISEILKELEARG